MYALIHSPASSSFSFHGCISDSDTEIVLVARCVRLFVTLWTVAHQAPLSMGILQARILEWVAIPFSRGSSQPRDRTLSPSLKADSLLSEPPGNTLTCLPLKRALVLYCSAAAKLLQSCSILYNPIDVSPPGSTVLGILQARTLEWVAIPFSVGLYLAHLNNPE